MFDEIVPQSFDVREKSQLDFWREEGIFERSVEQRRGQQLFSFYDGPPFATGLPHYGHLLAGTIKDVVLRYQAMKGRYVPRRFGWDCHGLPVENEIEKAFDLAGASSIEEFGLAKFNEECRKIVLRYTSEWQTTVERMGRWVDFSNTYRTMDPPFMESVWWVFKQLYDQGLVYEGYKVVPFSAKLGTPLSNFEASENYKEVDDPSLTVALQLIDRPDTYLLIWTTTPWTLTSNLAVLAGPALEYVEIHDAASGRKYILAAARVAAYTAVGAEQWPVLATYRGSDLVGMRYRPLFPYFAARAEQGAFRIVAEEGVALDEGTGLVHCAPGFGEMDFYACAREGIELVCPVDKNGFFTDEVPDYAGRFVKDADKEIAAKLKAQGLLFVQATCRHRYPFCWRSDTPLIYRAMRTWFIAVEKIKPALLAANEQIHWTPPHIKQGRFGKWLEGARDWAFSRNRYWGTPIPLWRAADGEVIAIGSVAELQSLTGQPIEDLHRHYIDDLTFVRAGKVFRRIPEVFDCWFESGSMPYAQNHYPFENGALFDKGFPADFIAEGIDQTRGWFYTLTVLAAALRQQPAFKNVIVNGIVLAADGAKMSKRLRNYPDPTAVVEKYGADAIRLYMLHSPAVRAEDFCFSEGGVELILRQILIPWWNAYSFFITYARIYSWTPSKEAGEGVRSDVAIDKWILSLLHRLVQQVQEGMAGYDLSRAVEPFVAFIDQITNWYIRRSRRRFWAAEDSVDRQSAFLTLYEVLLTLTQIAASFVPFTAEAIYRNMRSDSMKESVHLCDFPEYRQDRRDIHLEEVMAYTQAAVSLGHALRKEQRIKVRQPLAAAFVASDDPKTLAFLEEQKHLIAEELNVKEVFFSCDEERYVSLEAKPNFRALGKKVGKKMKGVQEAIAALDRQQRAALRQGSSIDIVVEGEYIAITPEDVAIERRVRDGLIAANEGHITVALDMALTEELLIEGLAREIVNKVNTMRREGGLAVTDRIRLFIDSSDKVRCCLALHGDYIREEVLAVSIDFSDHPSASCWDLNGEQARIAIEVVKR